MPTPRTMILTRADGGALEAHADGSLFVFARFHARNGREADVAAAIAAVHGHTSEEPGCMGHSGFRSVRDARLFYIFSRWRDEAAFETHANMAHTLQFLEQMEPAIDHALDVARTSQFV